MDYKEEYQKALERAKKGLPIDEVFPELKESEDEKIRKFLVELVSNDKANNYNGLYEKRGVRFDDVLAYLEKQKEQKPSEWSEEDKEMYDRCVANAKKHIPIPDKNGHLAKIEERVDEELVDWLKRRFFNIHWKPSEEQMEALKETAEWKKHSNPQLFSLYNDIKKLM